MSDDARRLILARRARFVAAALVGLTTEGCGKTTGTAPVDAGAEAGEVVDAAPPEPSFPPPVPADAAPRPCLSVPRQAQPQPLPPQVPRPRPCLTPPRTPDVFDGCEPPFTIDANGVKHFKKECL